MSDEAQTTASWLADGTKEAEPETTETPAAEVEAVETTEAVEVVETTEVTEAVETEAAETVEEVIEKFIEGRRGEEAFQLPEDVLLPQTRGGETTYESVQDLLKRGMLETDYRHKTSELADEKRNFELSQATLERERAALKTREDFLAEREEQTLKALTTEEGALRHQRHLQMYRDDPSYRETWDKGWANRETEAERDSLLAERDRTIVQEGSTRALAWIESLATEFEGVDPARIASTYGQRLTAGQASLDISEVRKLYEAEADYLSRASEPLRNQMANLSAKIDTLTASQAAEEHNDQTAHAVARAKAPKVATGKGAPTTVPVAAEKFGPNELHHKISEWNHAGGA